MAKSRTQKTLRNVRCEYEKAFPQFNESDSVGVFRTGGICRQYLTVYALRDGAYRVSTFVNVRFLPPDSDILPWAPPPGLSRIYSRQHERRFPEVCEVLRERVRPSVEEPLTDEAVRVRLGEILRVAPGVSVHHVAAYAGLLATSGRIEEAQEWCRVGRERVSELTQIGADGVDLIGVFVSELGEAKTCKEAEGIILNFQSQHSALNRATKAGAMGTIDRDVAGPTARFSGLARS